jgi:hypothetical protein
MALAQRQNRLTTHLSERIPVLSDAWLYQGQPIARSDCLNGLTVLSLAAILFCSMLPWLTTFNLPWLNGELISYTK